jgi:hypothetical protein
VHAAVSSWTAHFARPDAQEVRSAFRAEVLCWRMLMTVVAGKSNKGAATTEKAYNAVVIALVIVYKDACLSKSGGLTSSAPRNGDRQRRQWKTCALF